ncbi:MAG TPA: GNAT family N-acetyltransferase [Ktedonobacterales bacterium]|jgi:diamine N-acetyltransferase
MTQNQTPQAQHDAAVTLREVTKDTVGDVCSLQVATEQREYVANNAFSIAQAHFEPKAWFRAIYADETPVGFMMLSDDPDAPEYFLWRLMIDHAHQGKGYGRSAIALLVEYVRTRPAAHELLVSYHPGPHSPRDFYLKQGFLDTGRTEEGEVVLSLPLDG